MEGFDKYRELSGQGATPIHIYHVAKADGLDEIARIRLLRTVYNLSLAEVKKVIGAADVWDRKQDVKVGATVYWEEENGSRTDVLDLVEARVTAIEDDQVRLQPVARSRVTQSHFEELPVDATPKVMPRATFETTIAERLKNVLVWRSRWADKHRADLAHTE
jgi:hypothetical protein